VQIYENGAISCDLFDDKQGAILDRQNVFPEPLNERPCYRALVSSV